MKRILTTLSQKWPEYLLEILVITVGILGAFGLNNWNDERNERKTEEEYINSLKSEFSYNQVILKELIFRNEEILSTGEDILKHTGPTQAQISEKEFGLLMIQLVGSEVQFRPSDGILVEIIGTGKLGVFQNKKLREELSSWSGNLYKIRFQEEEVGRIRIELLEYARSHMNIRQAIEEDSKFESNNLAILQMLEFENLMIQFNGSTMQSNEGYYSELLKKIDAILLEIENDLKE